MIAITNARLIDGTGAEPVENATLIVRDGCIEAAERIDDAVDQRVRLQFCAVGTCCSSAHGALRPKLCGADALVRTPFVCRRRGPAPEALWC